MAGTAAYEKKKQIEVTLTVAECSEFHNMGELHEGIGTVKEAIVIFRQIPPDRMHGIPAIGIRVTDKAEPELFTEIDIATAKVIDMEMLGYVPDIAKDKGAQFAIAEIIHAFPESEIRGKVPDDIQKKVQILESREKQAAQLEAVTAQLEQGVKDVFNSDEYKSFLNVMARMPRYSLNNQLLIAMQTEGKATMCQSFTGWKEMGRFVKKGEKGIKIFAPASFTIQREQDKLDQVTGMPILDADGEPVKETKDVTINAFKVVSTFDVAQTDGKELPTISVNELVGNIEGYGMLLEALKEVSPVPITFENIDSGAKGYYHQTDKRIAIQEDMSEVQTVKTLIHEMAHQKLHAVDLTTGVDKQTRESKEVEAESVAYVVCQHLGINTSEYSFGYVAGWSDGKETPELKASLGTIRNAAADIITAIDEKLEHVRGAIEKATNEFTSIFMQDQDKGNLMMGEYLSMLNYDPEMGDKGVKSSKLIVEDFLKKDIHTEAEIRETGMDLLVICKRENVEFPFDGKVLLEADPSKNVQDNKITLEDITNIKCVSDESYPTVGQKECKLSCEIKGDPNTITYLVQRHDDGDGFTLSTEGTDIWDVMSASDLRKLKTIVSQEVEVSSWQRQLAKAETVEAVQNVKYGLMDAENSCMSKEQMQKVMGDIYGKEQSLMKASAKEEKKPSVKRKLQTKKEATEKKPKETTKKPKSKEERV